VGKCSLKASCITLTSTSADVLEGCCWHPLISLLRAQTAIEAGKKEMDDIPKYWIQTKLNTLFQLGKHDAESKEVDKVFRASLLEGYKMQYHMWSLHLTYNGSYLGNGACEILKKPLSFETLGVCRAQYPIKFPKYWFGKREIALSFNGGRSKRNRCTTAHAEIMHLKFWERDSVDT
jgi:hypothetical protein